MLIEDHKRLKLQVDKITNNHFWVIRRKEVGIFRSDTEQDPDPFFQETNLEPNQKLNGSATLVLILCFYQRDPGSSRTIWSGPPWQTENSSLKRYDVAAAVVRHVAIVTSGHRSDLARYSVGGQCVFEFDRVPDTRTFFYLISGRIPDFTNIR